MTSREQWQPILDAEIGRWKAKPWERLVSELVEERVYEVEYEAKKFQVEVHLLENTENYIHVCVSVDDGSLPASLFPLTSSFILSKESPA